MNNYEQFIFLKIGSNLYLEYIDKKYIEILLEDTKYKIEEYIVKIEEYKKHLDYMKSSNYNIDDDIKYKDINIIEKMVEQLNNISKEHIVYFDILNSYII